jgi:hypothetical protein
MSAIDWDIHREGRAWDGDEMRSRYNVIPEKIELIQGKLFWGEEVRLNLLALLLENVGVDKAVRLGSLDVWREAISQLGT